MTGALKGDTPVLKRASRTGLYVDGRFTNMETKKGFVHRAKRIRLAIYGEDDKETSVDLDRMWVNAIKKLCDLQNVTIPFAFTVHMPPKQLASAVNRIGNILPNLENEIRINEAIINDDSYIELDEDWKSRAGSYIAHIRDLVSKADVSESLRERIFKRLNKLQGEIDRNRTQVESIAEVFLSVTEAVGKGAKNLEGAVRLIERLAGALSGARTAKLEHETQLKLPAPDNFGFAEPDV